MRSELKESGESLANIETGILSDLNSSKPKGLPSVLLPEPLPEGVRAVQEHAKSQESALTFSMNHVASDYYDWPLEKRAYVDLMFVIHNFPCLTRA